MDDTISIHKFKRRKFLMGEDADKGEDKISKMPDSILRKILSLLPIEDVLRTSLLSKRWRYLWTSISDLDFFENSLLCRPFLADTNFVNSVERLLLLHDSSNIQKFHLKLDLSVCPLRVTTWIAAAVRCQVQEFDLSLPNEVPVVLPDNLFTCELLKKLKLQMNSIFIFPDLIHMTNLTALHVTATFPYDRSTENLFSGCPLLQELVLHNCVWRHSDIITISVPNIRTLTISRDCLQPFPHGFYDSVRISAPKLTSLKCINYLSGEVFLCNLPSLVDAYIDIQGMKYMDVVVHERAIKLLGGVCEVKSLTVSNRTLPIFASYDIFRVPLPVFGNLTHLKVNSVHRHTSAELLHILRKSPNLESLEMPMGIRSRHWYFHIVPSGTTILSCLKTLILTGYCPNVVEDVYFLRHLLQNAMVLEKITIICSETIAPNSKTRKKIIDRFQVFCLRRRSCVIEFLK